jgi:SAM-dependent methyltransferase
MQPPATPDGRRAGHWETVWTDRDPTEVTWYQPVPRRQLELVTSVGSPDDRVIDVGGGASTLVDGLLERGYRRVTVLDISEAALDAARRRLGDRADLVDWVVGDVLDIGGFTVDVWHDRAVFHFLVDPIEQARYVANARAAVRPGGHLVVATFGPDGPGSCSGLPVRRHDIAGLAEVFTDGFVPVGGGSEIHVSPTGLTQPFVDVVLRRSDAPVGDRDRRKSRDR